MRRIVSLGILVLLAGCASPDRVDMRDRMVGLDETQLASCMGPPASKQDIGPTETWTYYAPDETFIRPMDASMIPRHSQTTADEDLDACVVTIKLEADKVTAVDYVNMASTREDDSCVNALQRCGR